MKSSPSWLVLVAVASLLLSCQSTDREAGQGQTSAGFSDKMRAFQADLNQLAPYLFSEQRFESEKNEKVILDLLKKMQAHSHDVRQLRPDQLPDGDPSMAFAAQELNENFQRAVSGFAAGHKRYAQATAKDALGQCFHCHTRNNSGPQFQSAVLPDAANWAKLSDQIEYLTALRRFDEAISLLRQEIQRKDLDKVPALEVERIARKLLALTVRVKRDPALTLQLINELETVSSLSPSLRQSIQAWKVSARNWQQETQSKPTPGATPDSLLKRAEVLFEAAEKTNSSAQVDFATDIELLRASTLLHDFLQTRPTGARQAKALYLLGKSYERLGDIGFWDLPERYYEACVNTHPNSLTSQLCFQAWEEAITVGYSGSSGTYLPEPIQEKRAVLKSLSQPK